MNKRILVVGSHAPGLFLRVRRPPGPGETVMGWDYQEPDDGGKGSNQAIAAARLGGKVSFVGCVGRDRIGEAGERLMQGSGVDTTFLYKSPETPTGLGFIMLAEDGVPAMVSSLGANVELSIEQVDRSLSRLRDVGVILVQLEIRPDVTLHALQRGKESGLLTILNPAPAPERPLGRLEFVDILVPNDTEARQLLALPPDDLAPLTQLASRLRAEFGVQAALVTAGENGVFACDRSGTWNVLPPPVEVVDTSGAGDMFCAALAVALMEGQSLRKASAWACSLASFSVTHPGTIPAYPPRSEADDFLRGINLDDLILDGG